ncbi:MAG TPA: hypothetical protein VF855_11435 [Acidimicrobiales bacterium]
MHMNVVVPIVLGAGLLFSLVTMLRDVIHQLRGDRSLVRHGALRGQLAALVASEGLPAARTDRVGFRSKRFHLAWGLGVLVFGVYLMRGATLNYSDDTGWAARIAWIWVAFVVVGVAFVVVGLALLLSRPGACPPPWARSVLYRTPLTKVPRDDGGEQ